MKSKFLLIWLVAFTALMVAGCQSESDSLATKEAVLKNIQNQVSNDPVFKAYEDAFSEQLSFALSQRNIQQKFDQQIFANGIEQVQTQDDYLNLCEKAGIVDAKKRMTTHYRFLVAQKALYSKYPQIQKLSREDMALLMEKSDSHLLEKLNPTHKSSKLVD